MLGLQYISCIPYTPSYKPDRLPPLPPLPVKEKNPFDRRFTFAEVCLVPSQTAHVWKCQDIHWPLNHPQVIGSTSIYASPIKFWGIFPTCYARSRPSLQPENLESSVSSERFIWRVGSFIKSLHYTCFAERVCCMLGHKNTIKKCTCSWVGSKFCYVKCLWFMQVGSWVVNFTPSIE